MKKRIYVKIKASENFWQEQLKDLITSGSRFKITELKGKQIQIESENYYHEMDIVELSRRNPEQILVATYTGEDHFENLATTSRYINGIREFVKEEYEYYVNISDEDKEVLPPGLYDKFKQKVLEYFQKTDNYRVRTCASDQTFQKMPVKPYDDEDDSLIIPSFELIQDEFKITAKKFGLTYLVVSVDRTHHASSPRDNDHLSEEYDDWMSEEYALKRQDVFTSLEGKNNCINKN